MTDTNKLVVFQNKKIRRTWHNNEWYFCVGDIIFVLTDSLDALAYWRKLKQREPQLVTICHALKLEAADNKMRLLDCVNTENAFRLIQSIPSKKAEPFKRWLAKAGYERVQEIEDPELAQKRMKGLYKAKGYSDAWIEKRVRGIAIRDELTDEWEKLGVETPRGFSILTAEISKATFGLTPKQYKEVKNLDKENLRDHMTDFELIFTMLGEASTTKIAQKRNARGFDENKIAAQKAGKIAGDARRQLEIETGERVVSTENYLDKPESQKRLESQKNLSKNKTKTDF